MKQHISAYLIYVKERDETESSNFSFLDVSRRAFLDEYADCFSEALPGQLPPERPEDHNIDLIPNSAAPNKPPYRVSAVQQEEIMTQVNELLQKGHIQSRSSPFCSPVLLVQKKHGSWRMCIDYRALNKIIVKIKFPIPHIDDVLDRLQGASFFSTIDLKSGYHQIRVNPADVPKTAFRTTFGLYEFLVMPFGLTNAPATFNRNMDKIFRPLCHCVGTFFDDMIVFSKSEAEHMEHLRAVFEMLRKKRLVVNGKKSEFFMEEIHFLGHIVSKDGVRMDLVKIEAIQDWPEPINLHEDKRSLLKQDPLPMDFGIEDGLDKIGDEMTAVIFSEMLLLDSTLLHRQHLPPLSQVDKDYAPFVMVTIGDKSKQAVRAVRVSKVVSALMLNANTNVSVPVNLSNQVLSLLGFVGKHPLNVLVDSGCSINFVSTMLVSKLRLPTQQSVEDFQVELADGSYLQCNKKVQQLEFQIQDYHNQLGFSIMLLSHYDLILGQSWLYQYDPIISFRDHSIWLFRQHQEVELRGLFNTANYNGICYASEAFGLSSYVPEIEDEHVILVPEMILDVRQKETRRKLTTEFLVKWMDLDESDSTWQTDEEM
ncbi:hypothetical protein L7F22_019960 [Adiantum nelumboides]|nr:hypothetical protein [Adiantum nelumboides]